MVRLCNQIIMLGIKTKATDIHIEPDEKILRVRMRVDGILRQDVLMPKQLQPPIIARFKLMANINVTEKRIPQDGHITFTIGHRPIDLRISTMPTSFGESVVMRILDKTSVELKLEALGFNSRNKKIFSDAMTRSHGMILVTGPTGSGKNTTLYTGMMQVNAMERSIFTLEDPIEYEFPLVRQTQINPDVGMTFPVGLRALLRQDPDVILVGEIRDQETAQLAMRAAFTGHLVLSTLHTNDAIGAIPRLLEMGIEAYLIPSVLVGVVGQRLIRCICKECKVERDDVDMVLRGLRITAPEGMESRLWHGKGCDACGGTGYRGRMGIYEIFSMGPQFHDPIARDLDLVKIHQLAKEAGMQTMFEDGIEKAMQGRTTIEEVVRVTNG
jgi:type II secretory ATPase GspE/PulE/Tfp pilus assembly ATPase PilB-like protein